MTDSPSSTGFGAYKSEHLVLPNIIPLAASLFLCYRTSIVIYRLYFHPLASFPGPKLYAASYFPFLFAEKIQGTFFRDVAALHERYGPIVRIAPNRLAIEPEIAWKEIFAHNGSRHEFFRDKKFFRNPDSLIAAYTEDHRRQRRQVASAFSESALYQQEVHIMKYVNLLMERLKEKADARMAVDLVKWFNFIAFDVIGDLTFAESFGCLETGDYHPWIAVIFASVKSASNLQFVMHYPLLRPLAWYMLGWDGLEKGKMHREVGRQRAEKRIARGPVEDRKDFMTYILRDNNPGSKTGMTHEEIVQNTGLFMGAGSETTAGAMAGLIFHLTQAPHAYETLTEEIRSRFQSEDEINMRAVTKLPYLQACIEEGLRMYSPVPDMAPRVSTGETVAGRYIPKETLVTTYGWASTHSARYFSDPDNYLPERWLPRDHPFYEAARFQNDNKAIFKPFSYGPRDCIGRNLAMAEIRVIMARLLRNFDLQLVPGHENWVKTQRNYFVFEKGPLMVQLTPVHDSHREQDG